MNRVRAILVDAGGSAPRQLTFEHTLPDGVDDAPPTPPFPPAFLPTLLRAVER